jgi:YNFM family putative membrane transporter
MASIRLADPMLPALALEFGGDSASMAPVILLFTLAYGAMQLFWGPLGDRIGKLRVIAWAALAASLGSLACALAPSLPALSVARLLTGACCAGIIPVSIAFVGDAVPIEARQATLARLSTGTLTGMIAGQVLGGLAADTLGWRAGFGLLALVFLAAGLAAHRMQAARPRPSPPGPFSVAALLRGWAEVLGSRWSRLVLAVTAIEGALIFGALAFVPSWLHAEAGLSLTAAGGAVAALGLGGLAFTTTAGHWIARLGSQRLLTAGGVMVAIGFAALAAAVWLAGAALPWAAALAACAIAGFGFYMLHNTMQTLATQLAPQARATAVGLFAVSLFVGQSGGVAISARIGPLFGHGAVVLGAGLLMAAVIGGLGVAVGRRQAA